MIHTSSLPADIETRLSSLGDALAACPDIVFAYLFGSAGSSRFGPLSDVDVAVYLARGVDVNEGLLRTIRDVTSHLRTDEVDVVLLNNAPTALLGRVLQSRRVILDRDPFLRHRFESRSIREFLDFRIFEHRLLTGLMSRG